MSFLDRIAADNSAALEDEAEKMLADQAMADEIVSIRADIVDEKIKDFAATMAVDVQELPRQHNTRYYLVGDLVFAVRPMSSIDKSKLSTTKRLEVLWQHFVSIVGIDITLRTVEVGRGSLALLSYEGVRKGINSGSGIEFQKEHVVAHLYSENQNS